MEGNRKQQLGKWGEEQAALFLVDAGYSIVERNFHPRRGEIDIIAHCPCPRFGRTLCFIEVKTRSGEEGSAERATDRTKVGKMLRAAQEYCLKEKINGSATPIRFEHVSVYRNRGRIEVRHYEIPMDSPY